MNYVCVKDLVWNNWKRCETQEMTSISQDTNPICTLMKQKISSHTTLISQQMFRFHVSVKIKSFLICTSHLKILSHSQMNSCIYLQHTRRTE